MRFWLLLSYYIELRALFSNQYVALCFKNRAIQNSCSAKSTGQYFITIQLVTLHLRLNIRLQTQRNVEGWLWNRKLESNSNVVIVNETHVHRRLFGRSWFRGHKWSLTFYFHGSSSAIRGALYFTYPIVCLRRHLFPNATTKSWRQKWIPRADLCSLVLNIPGTLLSCILCIINGVFRK